MSPEIQQVPLSTKLDLAFQGFYAAIIAGSEPAEAEFDAAAFEFFDANAEQPWKLDLYFNNFTPLWDTRLKEGRFTAAAEVWTWALRSVLAWESGSGRRLHKGSAFYFSAIAKIIAGDLDTGYLHAHLAFEEDRVTHAVLSPRTPSLALVSMDPDNPNQAFRVWVVAQSALVLAALNRYENTHNRVLTFADFRAKLLQQESFSEATFMFAYSFARLYRLESNGTVSLSSDFAGQLGANILFDFTLVIDSVLRRIATGESKFIKLAEALSDKASLGLSFNRLREINGLFNTDFDHTATRLLDGTLVLNDGFHVHGLGSCLALTYGCRNRAAHDVTSIGAIRHRFKDVKTAVLDTLFLAVEVLQ